MNSDMLYHGTQRACTRQEQRIVRPLSCQFFFQVSCFCAVCHHESKDFGVNRRCSSLTLQAAKQRPGFRKHIGFLDHRQHKSSTAAGGESLGLKTEATGGCACAHGRLWHCTFFMYAMNLSPTARKPPRYRTSV